MRGTRTTGWLIALLFLSTIAIPQVVGRRQNPRLILMLEAGLFASVLGLIAFKILWSGEFNIDTTYVPLFGCLCGFLMISIFALGIGLSNGFEVLYTFGDLYKFTLLPASVAVLYLLPDTTAEMRTGLRLVHHMYLPAFVVALALYFAGVLPPNHRIGFLELHPIVLIVSYGLWREGFSGAKLSFPIYLLGAIPTLYFLQSLSVILNLFLTSLLVSAFLVDWDDVLTAARNSRMMLLIAAPLVLSIPGLMNGIVRVLVGDYVRSKLRFIVAFLNGDLPFYQFLLQVSGSRAAEPHAAWMAIRQDALSLLFGRGMGSVFFVRSPFDNPVWEGTDHFVHAGVWEALLRTGLTGAVLYVAFGIGFAYVAFRIRHEDVLGGLTATVAIINLILMPLMSKMVGVQFFLYFFIAYALRRWTERRRTTVKVTS